MVLIEGENAVDQGNGVFQKLKEKLQSLKNWGEELWRGSKSKLYVRKCMFQTQEVEWASYHDNIGRLRWLVEQAINDICSGMVVLRVEEMAEVAAMYMVLKERSHVIGKRRSSFPTEVLEKCLPKGLIPKSSNDMSVWINDVVNRIHEAIQEEYSEGVLMRRVLAVMGRKVAWYSMLFKVKNYDKASPLQTVFAGVNHSHFILL